MAANHPLAVITVIDNKGPMRSVKRPLSKLLRRWSHQQASALHQLSEGKTMKLRLSGFGKSERVDAKILLFALVPFVPVIVSDQIGWERGILWHIWFWTSIAWATATLGIGLAFYFRALGRSMRRRGK